MSLEVGVLVVSAVAMVLSILILVKLNKKEDKTLPGMGRAIRAVRAVGGNCDTDAAEYCANKSSCTSLPTDPIQCVPCDSYDGSGCVPAGNPNDPFSCPCTACITPPANYRCAP